MRVLVIGAAGMLGQKLVGRLAHDRVLGAERISDMMLVDVAPVRRVDAGEVGVETLVADIAAPGVAEALLSRRPDVVFDLAAVVSGACQRSAKIDTQRRSTSAVCGYSSLSIMFLSTHSLMRVRACGSIQVVTNVARFSRALPSSSSSSWIS